MARSVHAYLDAHTNQMLALLEALVGHCDTVWPLGTLAEVPFEVNGNVVRGPGMPDMKGGPVQMMFVLAALRAACVELAAVPIVFINSYAERGRGAQCRFESVEEARRFTAFSLPSRSQAQELAVHLHPDSGRDRRVGKLVHRVRELEAREHCRQGGPPVVRHGSGR